MKLSRYQEGIKAWALEGTGNACCNAVAGSGKTTTLEMVAFALEESGMAPSQIKIVVFNKANAMALTKRFGPRWKYSISTLHSAGWSILRKYLGIRNPKGLVNSQKYKGLAHDLGIMFGGELNEQIKKAFRGYPSDFLKLFDFIRLTNASLSEQTISDIVDHFDLTSIEIVDYQLTISALEYLSKEGEKAARNYHSFDFTDMIALPVKWGIKEAYNFILVDECQDLNAVQLELVCGMSAEKGRMLFVGDPRQSIMGFAGADCNSYQKILSRVEAVELPLSICYRCPTSHIELVKGLFPHIPIEPNGRGNKGSVKFISSSKMRYIRFTKDDLIISRKNAPLVSLCLELLASGQAASIKGKEIGEKLKREVKEIKKLGFSYRNFLDALKAYKDLKHAQSKSKRSPEKFLEVVLDQIEVLKAIHSSYPKANNFTAMERYIGSLFSDANENRVTLCTCHKAKGLEAERIFLYKPDDIPMRWKNIQPWVAEQEDNLLYVSLTRSKSSLYIVGDQDIVDEWAELIGKCKPRVQS